MRRVGVSHILQIIIPRLMAILGRRIFLDLLEIVRLSLINEAIMGWKVILKMNISETCSYKH
jgi:hypothetical protein